MNEGMTMARKGRKRKIVTREPNGRASRQIAQPQIFMEAVVLAQPHRKGNTDQRCATVLGHFCVRNKIRAELTDAGEEYGATVRRWRAAKGIPSPFHNEAAGSGRGPSDDTVATWQRRMLEMECAMMREGIRSLLAVKQLVLDGNDLGMDQTDAAIDGLMVLAVHLGTIRQGGHPYAQAA